MKAPSQLSLTVFHSFKASHTLTGFETPHFHLWKLAVEFSTQAPFQGDRLIDLVFLQGQVEALVAPLSHKHLNAVFSATKDFQPTSENMAQWLWDQIQIRFKEVELASVTVTLCDLEGNASGAAKLS